MYNKTLIDRLSEAKDGVVDLCTSRCLEIVFTVVILYAFVGGRRRWLNGLTLMCFFEAVGTLIFPKRVFCFMFEGVPDETHLELMQLSAFLILCWVLNYWLLHKSSDSTTETSLLLSGTVLVCCASLASVYCLTHQTKKSAVKINEKNTVPVFYVHLLIVVGNLYFYLSAKDWGGYGEYNSTANFHLRADFAVLMITGLLMYALPQWMLRLGTDVEKVDAVHACLYRCCASYVMSMALMSGRAANFLRTHDKEAVVFSHLLFYLAITVSTVCTAVQGWNTLPWKQTGLKVLFDVLLVFNAAGALNYDRAACQKILWPTLRTIPGDLKAYWKRKTM